VAISTRNIKPRAIITRQIKGIRLETLIDLLPGRYEGLALDTIGVKVDTPCTRYLSSWLLTHVRYAYFEVAYDVSGTTTGAFEARLRNVTDGTDIATISISPGTKSKRSRVSVDIDKLVAMKDIGVQFVVTSAAATGETGDFIHARLITQIGIF